MFKAFSELYNLGASVVDDLIIWAFQVAIGVGTKLALESRRRTLTKKYIFTSFIIASFVGYITDRACTYWGFEQARGVAVAVMALLSESVVKYFDENAGAILDAILRRKLNIDGSTITTESTETPPETEGRSD
jgi:hypothetical protein